MRRILVLIAVMGSIMAVTPSKADEWGCFVVNGWDAPRPAGKERGWGWSWAKPTIGDATRAAEANCWLNFMKRGKSVQCKVIDCAPDIDSEKAAHARWPG